MPLTLAELREDLDGLGYYMGPRGLLGLGGGGTLTCDASVLGAIDCSVTPLKDISGLDGYTQSAIYQFQVDSNLIANGANSVELQNKVEEAVKIVQNNLKIVLKNSLPITGRYRNQTIESMKLYQKGRNLPITGFATRPVRKLLDDDARKVLGTPAPTPTPAPSGELDGLRKLKSDLVALKQLHQNRTLTDDAFITAVYKLIP